MRDYFCGWYLKCQNETQTLALIPAYHRNGGERTCSIQVITDDGSWNTVFSFERFSRKGDCVNIDGNCFSREGVAMNLEAPEVRVKGSLRFGPLDPIAYDIMGPFRYVPFMQCQHSVFSMKHSVNGVLEINGKPYVFENGTGYIEGDRGSSFPREYLWTQCCFSEGSVMLSVADIPFCGVHFTGVIGVIHYNGQEYRLGTYLGARAAKLHDGFVEIRQGRKKLTVRRLEQKGHPLAAPAGGSMTRIVHETAACQAWFRYEERDQMLFAFESDRAAFEYEYPR